MLRDGRIQAQVKRLLLMVLTDSGADNQLPQLRGLEVDGEVEDRGMWWLAFS